MVRYGLITPSTNLFLRDFHQVKAHLVRLTSDNVNLSGGWLGKFMLLHVLALEYSPPNLLPL